MVSFEIGDLKPYVEYVRSEDLREGTIYFKVGYLDDMALVPMLQPYVFIGRNLDEDDEQEVYFQDAGSYASGIRVNEGHDATVADAFIISGSASEGHVME